MVIDLSKLNMNENPMLLLKNQNGDVLSPIAAVLNFQGDLLYNEISQISFNVPLRYNGITNSYYDKITSMQLIEWKDIGCFILQNPSTTGDGIKEIA